MFKAISNVFAHKFFFSPKEVLPPPNFGTSHLLNTAYQFQVGPSSHTKPCKLDSFLALRLKSLQAKKKNYSFSLKMDALESNVANLKRLIQKQIQKIGLRSLDFICVAMCWIEEMNEHNKKKMHMVQLIKRS